MKPDALLACKRQTVLPCRHRFTQAIRERSVENVKFLLASHLPKGRAFLLVERIDQEPLTRPPPKPGREIVPLYTGAVAAALVGNKLWARIAPLFPKRQRSPKGGRPPVPDRAALTGVLFVLRSGIPWEMLPQEMGCGSGMTCWRRLRDWNEAGCGGSFTRSCSRN